MSVHDAEPNDVYVDAEGKLWRVVAVCHQPTVTVEEVEGTLFDPNAPPVTDGTIYTSVQSCIGLPARASIHKARQTGGVGGIMWQDWRRIYRPL